jgi:protocatechuate 3,4-dioxygenase, alpha subunit
MMSQHATTSQTVGPFFTLGLEWLCGEDFARGDVPGERVVISGKVLDGEGRAVPDALLEIWQANENGRYAHPEDSQERPPTPGFLGFGRVATDDNGHFRFGTIKPGRVVGPDGKLQAPHLVVSVFCRGLLRRLVTRIYFPGEASNAEDFALLRVEESRRPALIARPTDQPGTLRWNVILQGAGETVFFDVGV